MANKRSPDGYPYIAQYYLGDGSLHKRMAYKDRSTLEAEVRAAVQGDMIWRIRYAGPALQMDWTRGGATTPQQ